MKNESQTEEFMGEDATNDEEVNSNQNENEMNYVNNSSGKKSSPIYVTTNQEADLEDNMTAEDSPPTLNYNPRGKKLSKMLD